MSDYYPIMLRLQGRRCVVIGGGEVAERRVMSFLSCGALVRVISPDLSPALRELAVEGQVEAVFRRYAKGDLEGATLVVAASDDSAVNEAVSVEGRARGLPVNVVDSSENSSYIVPSVLRRGDLLVAVSTSARSPALARKIREELEGYFGEEYAALMLLVSEIRAQLKEKGTPVPSRDWNKALELETLLGFLREGHYQQAKQVLLGGLEGKEAN